MGVERSTGGLPPDGSTNPVVMTANEALISLHLLQELSKLKELNQTQPQEILNALWAAYEALRQQIGEPEKPTTPTKGTT